ncbi:hypothetical protein [Francisella sp. SYW-9]|uniref:hypothetical protein n=1 Tax=Francisella sp. SYW-9 TaxID=2610888 RepID=UPI00123CA9A5|nr:hypothetical protein [Francisella sp. SYW-9]
MRKLIQKIEDYTHRSNGIFSRHGEEGKKRTRLLQDIVNRYWLSSIYDESWKEKLNYFLDRYLKSEFSSSDLDEFIIKSTDKC